MNGKELFKQALEEGVSRRFERELEGAEPVEPSERMKRFEQALKRCEVDPTGATLLYGFPEKCEGNGEHPDYECCCDECDYFLECFPKEDLLRKHGIIVDPVDDEEEPSEEEELYLSVCRVKCKHCGDVLERRYKSPNDYGGGMMTCTCGRVGFDPGPVLWRVNGNPDDYEILHELAEKGEQK